MTTDKINELRRLLAEATPGAWKEDEYGKLLDSSHRVLEVNGVAIPCGYVDRDSVANHNRRFIIAAHNATTELLDRLEELEAESIQEKSAWEAERKVARIAEGQKFDCSMELKKVTAERDAVAAQNAELRKALEKAQEARDIQKAVDAEARRLSRHGDEGKVRHG